MIDWLRKEIVDPSVEVAGHDLPLAIRRNARAKRLTMRLAPDGSEVRITMPRWGRTVDALAFAHARAGWLAEQLGKVPERQAIAPGGTMPFRGRDLRIDWHGEAPRPPRLDGDRLTCGGPVSSLDGRLRRWLESQALDLASADLDDYCARVGLPVPMLRLSRARRRWGSCSGRKCIRVNWRLVMAPDSVRRSVVAHEVAHLVHFDHSPAFHALLSDLFEGDIGAADAWLKAQGAGLYSHFA